MRSTGCQHGVLLVVAMREEGEGRVRLALLVVTPAVDVEVAQHAGEAVAQGQVVDLGGELEWCGCFVEFIATVTPTCHAAKQGDDLQLGTTVEYADVFEPSHYFVYGLCPVFELFRDIRLIKKC